jgi:Putative peptidoglycan binding domain
MNTKPILFLSCFVAVTLAASVVTAAPRGGNHSMGMSPRGGRPVVSNGMRPMGNWNGQHWNGGNWGGDWHHHHHHHHDHDNFNDVVFIGGFPFWGWGWGYPYGYYGYPPYGYYGNGYYGNSSYGYGDRSRVAEMQRRLAQAGYYHGSIDGIMGPRTRRAMRAYQRDHGTAYG